MECVAPVGIGIWISLFVAIWVTVGLIRLFRPLIRGILIASRLKLVTYVFSSPIAVRLRVVVSGLPRLGT